MRFMKPLFFVHIPKTGGTSLMEQANEQGLRWGEKNPFYSNQPFKHHQPLQWYIPDRNNHPREIIESHELFAVLRHPVSRFTSDLRWHIERRPATLEAFGYTRQAVEKDVRPFIHDVLDLIETLDTEALNPIPNELIPFRVRRRFQKNAIRSAGLKNFGYGHFLPQRLFCEYEGEEVISHYFDLKNIEEITSFMHTRGLSFQSDKKANASKWPILLENVELERIQSIYADDIRFYESKTARIITAAI